MMIEKNTVINPEQLARLEHGLKLAVYAEQQAKKLCDLAEKFAQKYEACLGK